VKTRIAERYGAREAAAIARTLTERVAEALGAAPLGWSSAFCVDDPTDPFLVALAAAYRRPLFAQGAGDLGARMARAAITVLDEWRRAAVIVVGSDCLGYDPAYLRAAAAALESGADAVLGPAADGGYVLIGMRRCPPGLFSAIAWSTAGVAEQQRARLRVCGLGWEELPVRTDIDRPEDLPADFDRSAGIRRW
jgi:rSAM/selenodomain-associated transferase 1